MRTRVYVDGRDVGDLRGRAARARFGDARPIFRLPAVRAGKRRGGLRRRSCLAVRAPAITSIRIENMPRELSCAGAGWPSASLRLAPPP